MNRRGFLASCLALAAAPAIVRADSLMRIVPRETLIVQRRSGLFTGEVCEFDGITIHRQLKNVVAQMQRNHIRPRRIDGEDCYVAMFHPDVAAIYTRAGVLRLGPDFAGAVPLKIPLAA